MAEILDGFEKKHPNRMIVERIDVGRNRAIALKYKVTRIPTLVFESPERETLLIKVGVMQEDELLKTWEELGYPLYK